MHFQSAQECLCEGELHCSVHHLRDQSQNSDIYNHNYYYNFNKTLHGVYRGPSKKEYILYIKNLYTQECITIDQST